MIRVKFRGAELGINKVIGEYVYLHSICPANYGMPINTNLCINKFIKHKSKTVMLQAASIYSQGRGERWDTKKMYEIMLEISRASLKAMGSDLFTQITSNK